MAALVLEALYVVGVGFALGLSLAAPPGPILALSAERTAERGFWPGAAVPLGATVGDGTHALLMSLGLLPLLADHPTVLNVVNLGGAVLMFVLAYQAVRGARGGVGEADRRSAPLGGLGAGYLIALTSPYNFAWWLGAGTRFLQDYGVLLFVGFFAALVAFSLAFPAFVAWARERIDGFVRWVAYVSAVLLAAFGIVIGYQALAGLA